ncbi:non-ribosomal peptide synthetase [Bradyrhizobium sp. 188]|uniref:non-ribosomal peptide synthetase n=1 Tax=Bradyrhizobium sp. 188 TaxID=2782656 RepID=UPI001FF708F6|nr:non-ribosomal peptide synthetase [Bradyrhizobium sp. 188]MCK1502142.1 amino acid adenylation domain-containing protein [Bradyrhizobium sp. 188]
MLDSTALTQSRRARLSKLMDEGEPRAFPLSFAQARLWILDRFQADNPTYNIPSATRLQGSVNERILERALNEIVRRHEALRTTFVVIDGKPAQLIHPELTIRMDIVDLRNRPATAREAEMNAFVFAESRRPFDLANGPLFRASLVRLSNVDHLLVLVMHHIVSDGWSMSVLYRELTTLYMAFLRGAPSPLPELAIQYADFAEWQTEWFRGDVLQRQLKYWRKQLAGLRPVLDLPTDRPRPRVQTNNGAVIGFTLDRELTEDLKTLSQASGATLFMTLLAAFKTLLHRLSGETDIAVGSPIANRTRSELESLIGFFVNTLVLRTDLSGDCSFLELLARVREVALGAYGHQDMPFEKLVEELQPERDLTHNPLFQILFAVQNIGAVDRGAAPILPSGIDPRAGTAGNGTAKFDITMSLLDTGAGARGFVEFNTDLFDTSTMEALIERYVSLLKAIVANPEERLSCLSIWTPSELETPPESLIGPDVQGPARETIGALIAMHAAETPQSPAALAEEDSLSYAELNGSANRLAHRLLSMMRTRSAGIAIAMSPGLDALKAAVAVLKAGFVWLPIDPSELTNPSGTAMLEPGRLKRAFDILRPELAIVDDRTAAALQQTGTPTISFHDLLAEAAVEPDHEPQVSDASDALAIRLAISDATGQLRLVTLTHRLLCRFAADPAIGPHAQDRVAHRAHAASDRARYEVIATLAAGAAIVFVPRDITVASRRFATAIRDRGVTVMFAATADIERMAREFPWALQNVRLMLSDEGPLDWPRLKEALKPQVLDRICQIWGDPAAGGYYLVQPFASVDKDAPVIPMGLPAAGVRISIQDRNLEQVPPGIAGELHVENRLLPRGSADYSTGDVARLDQQDRLILHHRRAGATMLAGVKVYAAEVELALQEHPGVREVAVAERVRQGLRARGQVAFVKILPPTTLAEVKEFAIARLPDYLLPSAFSEIESVPRNVDGTVDRRTLAEIALQYDAPKSMIAPYVAPRDDLETALAQIWMDVLNTDRIGVHDNFFRLGGHSLIATQMVARISDAFHVDFPLQTIFQAPTIEQIARIIRPLIGGDYQPEIPVLVPVARNRAIPVSFAQQRLWFLDQFEPDSALYNINLPMRFAFAIDQDIMQGALNKLVARHETLRTTFDVAGDEPVQVIAPSVKMRMPVHDLRDLPEATRSAEIERMTLIEAQKPFNLKTGPVLRAQLVRIADNDNLVLLTIHHIATDGWSMDILFRELFAFYEEGQTGKPAALPPLPIQYADFANWQRRWLSGTVLQRQVFYWTRQLEGAPSLLELPTDRPRPPIQTFNGRMHVFAMPPSVLETAKLLSAREQVTLFTTLLAAFYVLLHRYAGREDLVVGTPIANRVRPELEGLIGFFANTLVLRSRIHASLGFREVIGRVRDVAIGAYAHQDIPFEKLVEELQPERNLSYNPLFQVMFALQNTGRPSAAGAIPDDAAPVLGAGVAKFDLTMFVTETASDLRIGIEYNSDLFDTSTIVRLCGHYEALLIAACAEPERPIWSLPMLSSAENLALAQWNETARDVRTECVHKLFESQAEIAATQPAVIFEGTALTYRQLNERANAWAHRLIELGAGRDTCVALCLERSADLIVAVLATLKAGAAYVPVDPNYPVERVAFMISDSGAPIILTQIALLDRLAGTKLDVLVMDDPASAPEPRCDNPGRAVSGEDLAYVIYTSGSTGRPKGVGMPRAPLASLVEWQIGRSKLAVGAPTLQFASLSFDVSFQEIFSTLCARGTLVMIGEERRRDPRALWQSIAQYQVQRLFLPYVALQQLATQATDIAELPVSLTEVITAGEQLQITPQIATLFERLGAALYNQYGPTESHVVAELKLAGSPAQWPARPAIGRPVPNATLHVLDGFAQSCPIGIPGELHIGGTALARGYLNQPELTAERFVPDTQGIPGSRLYRTGDRARYLANGDIQFIGRVDDQVKIRGFRVEPGEVEAALRTHPSILEAVVVAREEHGETRLAAYVQADPRNTPTPEQLRQHLAATLPDYMLPVRYVTVPALPLTPSGKLNRGDLPDPQDASSARRDMVGPRTPVEEALVRIWCDVLQVERVGIHDNFFELGGHSLLATRVISRIRDEFHGDFPVRRIFEAPTIEALALSIVETVFEQSDDDDEIARLLTEIEEMPEDKARMLWDNVETDPTSVAAVSQPPQPR